jgi:hypothetical protein
VVTGCLCPCYGGGRVSVSLFWWWTGPIFTGSGVDHVQHNQDQFRLRLSPSRLSVFYHVCVYMCMSSLFCFGSVLFLSLNLVHGSRWDFV